MTILVLGIGSPFADDQAGWLVADQLSHVEGLQDKIQSGELIIDADDRPGLNLLDWLHLVDMVKTNLAETGNTYILQAKEIIGFSGMLSSHNLGVSPSLALAEVLGIKISHVTFWGIEGERYKPHEEISPAMLLAVTKVTEQIQARLLK